jgi:hypothetical protein
MSFFRLWISGYYNPVKMVEQLRSKPAPQWGFYALLIRAAFVSFLLYLPIALTGRIPTTPSNISFLSTELYYWHLIWLSPIVLGTNWLLSSAFMHVVLKLTGRRSDYNQILNIVGMEAIVVGTFLIVWDWACIAHGSVGQYLLGITHLVLSLWGVAIVSIGLKRILNVPIWFGLILSFIHIPIALPFGIMFMRSPV